MSLNGVLTLLFLLVFIVLPLVSRVLRQRSQPPASGGPARPAGGRGPDPADSDSEAPPWLAEAQRRVREARQQALPEASEASEAAPSGRPLVGEDPFAPMTPPPSGRPRVGGDPFAPMTPPPSGRPLVPEQGIPGAAPMAQPRTLVPQEPFERGLVDAAQRPGAAPAQRQRQRHGRGAAEGQDVPHMLMEDADGQPHGSRRGAKLEAVRLRFDRKALVSGLIWHEVLDEPAWKRQRGRLLSRPRSR